MYSNIVSIFLFKRRLFKYWSCGWPFAITTCVWLFCIACPCYSDRCTAPRRSSKRCRHIESDKQSAVTCTRTYAVEKGWNLGIEGWQSRTKLFLLSPLFLFPFSFKISTLAQPYIHIYYKIIANPFSKNNYLENKWILNTPLKIIFQ